MRGELRADVAQAASTVLITLAAGQFLMTLDSSVMNVAIATVAEDVGTTITGIQTAITLYTLVMAMLMVTGGKIGSMIGRRRAFAIGCVIYGLGSLTTALAPNLPVLILGWSVLEGIGAALILPAIVALVAGNFVAGDRPQSLRPGDGRGRHRRRGRSADRRHRHDLLLLAVGVRRRSAGRGRDPAARSADRRRTTGGQGPVRPGRRDPGGGRARAGGLRGAALLGVGVGDPEAGRAVVVGHVPDNLADPRRPADRLDVPGVGVAACRHGGGSPWCDGSCSATVR